MELSPSDELLISKHLTGDNRKDAVILEIFLQSSLKSKLGYGIFISEVWHFALQTEEYTK